MNQTIPFNKLIISPDNVRLLSTSKTADKELLASLRTCGLLQNLVVCHCKSGKYEVTAGGRRFAGLGQLVKEGVLKNDHPIDCKVIEKDKAVAASLSENVHRVAMHPVDEYLAFKSLHDQGSSENDIAIQFGISVKQVKMRLKLGGVSPTLLDKFKRGKLELDHIMAFTVVDDQDKQLSCWKDLSRSFFSAHHIRSWLTGEAETTKSPMARFISVAAYKKSGGSCTTDLFESVTYLDDRDLLVKLVEEKLQRHACKLEKDGWKWVHCSVDGEQAAREYLHLEPSDKKVPAQLKKKIEILEAELVALDNEETESDDYNQRYESLDNALDLQEERRTTFLYFTAQQKASAGCVVSFNFAGKLITLQGLMTKQDSQQNNKHESLNSDGKTAIVNEKETAIPQALISDLSGYRQQIVKSSLASNTAVAEDVLLYTLCTQLLNVNHCYFGSVLDARLSPVESQTSLDDIKLMPVSTVMSNRYRALNTAWLNLEDENERFNALRALTHKEKKALTAYCVAVSLTITVSTAHDVNKASEQIVADLGINFYQHWRPSADNYFKRLRIHTLLAHGAEWFGDDWAETHRKDKKKDLVKRFDTFFNGETEPLDNRLKEIRNTWLPDGFSSTIESPSTQ